MRPRRAKIRRASLAAFLVIDAWATAAQAASPQKPPPHPIPEYAPVQAILLSEDLFNYNYEASALTAAVVEAGAEVWVATDANRSTKDVEAALRKAGVNDATLAHAGTIHLPHGNIWMRDYGPIPATDAEGRLRFFDFRYDDAAKTNDAFPLAAGAALGVPVESVAFDLDGGNFLTTGALCFTSAPDVSISKDIHPERHIGRLGCRETVVVKDPPHAHLDMWAKVTSERTILVNELSDRTLEVAQKIYGHVPPELKDLRDALNRKAAELSRYLDVKRVPMPLPYRGAFRTYTNAVLVNGHAIVPSYNRYGWNYDDYPDSGLKAYYEAAAAKAYADLGFKTRFVNADGLIYNGGAFHCVTTHVPDGPGRGKVIAKSLKGG